MRCISAIDNLGALHVNLCSFTKKAESKFYATESTVKAAQVSSYCIWKLGLH